MQKKIKSTEEQSAEGITKKTKRTVKTKSNTMGTTQLSNPTDSEEKTRVVKFKKLSDNAVIPSYAHDGDAGMDVTAVRVEYDDDSDTYIYYTDIACETDKGVVCLGFARSSNCFTDAYLTNGVGVIDSATYRGGIQFRYKLRISMHQRVKNSTLSEYIKTVAKLPWYKRLFMCESDYNDLYNKIYEYYYNFHIDRALQYAPYAVGDRIGQLVFMEFPKMQSVEKDELSETDRGTSGHGSTGK